MFKEYLEYKENLDSAFSQEDLAKSIQKLGQNMVYTKGYRRPYEIIENSASKDIDIIFTVEEFAAHFNKFHPVKQTQIKINHDSMEISTQFDRDRSIKFLQCLGLEGSTLGIIIKALATSGIEPAVYCRGKGEIKDNKTKVELFEVRIGKLRMPAYLSEYLVKFYTHTLWRQIPAMWITDFMMLEDGFRLVGKIAKNVPSY